jgi:hypothetical protein
LECAIIITISQQLVYAEDVEGRYAGIVRCRELGLSSAQNVHIESDKTGLRESWIDIPEFLRFVGFAHHDQAWTKRVGESLPC